MLWRAAQFHSLQEIAPVLVVDIVVGLPVVVGLALEDPLRNLPTRHLALSSDSFMHEQRK